MSWSKRNVDIIILTKVNSEVKSLTAHSTGLISELILMVLENILYGAQGQAKQKAKASSAQQKYLAVFATNSVGAK